MKLWQGYRGVLLTLVSVALFLSMVWLGYFVQREDFTDLVTERAYIEDPHGVETIESVRGRMFKPFAGPLFLGNNSRPVWLKFKVAPTRNDDVVVVFQPNHTQLIDVYIPLPDGSVREEQINGQMPLQHRDEQILSPNVRVPIHQDWPVYVYARIRTPSTPVYVRAMSVADSHLVDARVNLVGGAFATLGVFITIIALLVYLATRDTLWLTFGLQNLTGLWVLISQLALFAPLNFDIDQRVMGNLVLTANAAHVLMCMTFYLRLYREFQVPLWQIRFMQLFAPLFVLLFGLIWTGHGDIAMRLNNAGVLAIVCIGLLTVFFARHRDQVVQWAYRVFYLGTLILMGLWVAPRTLSFQSMNYSTLYPNFPIAIFTMFVMLLILVRNTQMSISESLRNAEERRQAERALAEERRRFEEATNFYGMLMHEVKNPLATIRMAVSNLEGELQDAGESVTKRLNRVHRGVDDVDNIIRRGVEVDRLEQGIVESIAEPVDLVTLLRMELDQHAQYQRVDVRAPAHLPVQIDIQLMPMMMGNLIDNALKYSAPGSQVELYLKAEGTQWVLSVRNAVGPCGFPDTQKLFTKYYRSPLTARHSGIGLGLYWVRGVARHLGGDLIYLQEEQHVVFKLCIPN